MHQSVKDFVASKADQITGKILEIGSLDVNGSIRDILVGRDIVGIDIRPGVGVDQVMSGNALSFPDDSFDAVLYLETMEHDREFWKTISESLRVLKAEGRMIITTRGIGFKYHPHPNDYYRFTKDVFEQLDGFSLREVSEDHQASGIFFFGIK